METERRVGVAVDFSACSLKALTWAVDNILRDGDHLILVTVRPEGNYEEGEMQLWETTGSQMETFDGPHIRCVGFTVRKNRSAIPRERCSAMQCSQKYIFLPPGSQSLGCENGKEDCYFVAGMSGLDRFGSKNRLKKFKLKLGGITHTTHTKFAADIAFRNGFAISKSDHRFDCSQPAAYANDESFYVNDASNYKAVRKSKRVRKRRVMDVEYIEDDDVNEEPSYIGRQEKERSRTSHGLWKVSNGRLVDFYVDDISYGQSKLAKHSRKKVRVEKDCVDKNYIEEEEEEPLSNEEPGYKNKELGFLGEANEYVPTTRNRALKSSKDVGSGASIIGFPDGLPPAPSKKQKPKLSEVEQQLKRAEALQRRRLQSEKAAREAEAEAIRKILGHDNGKKKEEKLKKQHNELAQERATRTDALGSKTIRMVMGPTGTVVIFSDDIGLPDIFNSKPSSYPTPREKCAGPDCTNAYKYRDSKSKLPLCSLHCYKAIRGEMQPLIMC